MCFSLIIKKRKEGNWSHFILQSFKNENVLILMMFPDKLNKWIKQTQTYPAIPYLIVLHFLIFEDIPFFYFFIFIFYIFYWLKVCGNPRSSKSMDIILPKGICSLCVSVFYFANAHNISNLVITVISVMVTCDRGS